MLDETTRAKGHGHLLDTIVYIGDICVINVFFILCYFGYKHWHPEFILQLKDLEMFFTINLSYFLASLFKQCRLSRNMIPADKIAQDAAYFITIYVIMVAANTSIFKLINLPFKHWVLISVLLISIFTAWHIFIRIVLKAYRKKGYNFKNIVVVGAGLNAANTCKELSSVYSGYKILGYFNNKQADQEHLTNYLGPLINLKEYIENNRVDEVYYTLSGQDPVVAEIISACEKNMVRFHLIPNLFQHIQKKLSLQFIDTIPILSLRLEPLQHPFNRFIKRTMDILISLLAIIFVMPWVYLIFGTIIKLTSKGPILFVQKRTGFRGIEFNCYKFRSMCQNKDANNLMATKNDPRVTKVGAFMRKTSIDELPQFFNVLKGEMSVVGPRPHMLKHTKEYSKIIEKFMVRHLVKPGITGWAQVSGSRGETKTIEDMEERVRKDVWYIENWTPFLDLKIIFRTVWNAFSGEENAY